MLFDIHCYRIMAGLNKLFKPDMGDNMKTLSSSFCAFILAEVRVLFDASSFPTAFGLHSHRTAD